MISLHEAPTAPRALVYLAMFNASERAEIAGNPDLKAELKAAEPGTWAAIMERHRKAQRAGLEARTAHLSPDADAMRRQALHDLQAAAASYAALTDGRRLGLFIHACRVARYVQHGLLTEIEFRGAFMDAARTNGALAKHGVQWAVTTIRRAITMAQNDPLPPLANRFRTDRGGRS
jgi:hypothetical protein